MAANRFATMLHRRTNKLTMILVYALLEWILIFLLLLNSLFSFLIIKFADYFGLKRPCLLCSRIDHVLEPAAKSKDFYRDLLCDDHASEIGQLGYCSNHRKLAESQPMCEDCSSSSRPSIAYLPWMKQIGKVSENGEVGSIFKCSCCGVSVDESKSSPPCVLTKPSAGVFDYTHEGNLTAEAGFDDGADQSDRSRSEFIAEDGEEEKGIEKSREIEVGSDVDEGDSAIAIKEELDEIDSASGSKVDAIVEKEHDLIKLDDDDDDGDICFSMDDLCPNQATTQVDPSPEIVPQHLEFFIGHNDYRLIPVELIDSATEENQIQYTCNRDVVFNFEADPVVERKEEKEPLLPPIHESEDEAELIGVELVDNARSLVPEEEEEVVEKVEDELIVTAQAIEVQPVDVQETAREMEAHPHLVSEEDNEMQNDETGADVSIGTEIPDHELIDERQAREDPSHEMVQEDPSTARHDSILATDLDHDHGSKQVEEVEFKTVSVETSPNPLLSQLSVNDIEEDKVPDTPGSVDSLHQFNRKLLLLERRESGTEESLDGSVISDIEAGELTIEKLSSALRAERRALNALYSELEEERSASAVAANQTMAMINRLHEEKAAMQMEALQYQRMMEEQSEYDQEAMQLLNELMVKREKEKQELEKELEAYRRKVQEYEGRERVLMLRRKEAGIRSMTSSVSCSNAEDSDSSVDLNREVKEDDSRSNHQDCDSNHNTPADAVLYLEESLANFEEERMSILEELKVLEEKLFTMNSEEEEHFEDVRTFESGLENGNGFNEDGFHGESNGHHREMNGKHHQGTRMASKPKRLLPLFDAIELEAEDGVLNGNEHGFDSASQQDSSDSRFELESKRPAIEEDVDHVYERLQALEADREFLKHCVTSLKKGDKGVYLLQEILQHLRDLRNVDLRARNMEDGVL